MHLWHTVSIQEAGELHTQPTHRPQPRIACRRRSAVALQPHHYHAHAAAAAELFLSDSVEISQ